jgi:hypothetical protein
LDAREPLLADRPLQGTAGLAEREGRQGELDEQFTVVALDAREPTLGNQPLSAHRQLGDRELGRQGEYDQ